MKKLRSTKFLSVCCAIVLLLGLLRQTQAIDVPPNIKNYLKAATVTEAGYPSGSDQERTEFISWLTTNWADVLAEIEAVAPDERQQKVVLAGAEFLSPTNYVSFLSGLLDKYQGGKVKKPVVIDAISPGGTKYGFLEYNYQHPTIIAFCNRVKTLFPTETEIQEDMNNILSGEQKHQTGAALFMENRPEPEILPAP